MIEKEDKSIDLRNEESTWNDVQLLMNGNPNDKVRAITLLEKYLKTDRTSSIELLKILAEKDQPNEVRMYLASKLRNMGLTVSEFSDILRILSQGPDRDLSEFILKVLRYGLISEFAKLYRDAADVSGLKMNSQIAAGMLNTSSVASVANTLLNKQWSYANSIFKRQGSALEILTNKQLSNPFNPKRFETSLDKLIKKQRLELDSIFKRQGSALEILTNKQLSTISNFTLKGLKSPLQQIERLTKASTFDSAKPLVSFIETTDKALAPIREGIKRTSSFYNERELQAVKDPSVPPSTVKGKELLRRLKACKYGNKDWVAYQNICMDILSYCLVPPLTDPTEQSKTRNKLHRRDIIYNIPHGSGSYWTYLTIRYGLAIIVECKNYKIPLKENEMLISSKYLGKEKLSMLGLVISRTGLAASGKEAQRVLWEKDGKMLLSLNDDDMAKMLELKDDNDEPWKVIDLLERELRSSI